MSYKRNQVEEAIVRLFAPNCEKPPLDLRTRIKRLLDLDRSIGSVAAAEANGPVKPQALNLTSTSF